MARSTKTVDPLTSAEDELKAAFSAYIETLSNAAMSGSADAPVSNSKKAVPEPDEDGVEEDEEVSREDLESETLPSLKKMAKEAGYTVADLKGLDKDGVIDLLLGEDEEDEDDEEAEEDEDEEDEDEEDDDEEDEDEDEDDEEELTEDDLRAMPIGELRTLAKESGIKVTPAMKKPAIISALMDQAE